MTKVWIYRPVKPPVQSGTSNTLYWVLEYTPMCLQRVDPIMGWVGTKDTLGRHKIFFRSLDDAIGFTRENELDYEVLENSPANIYPKNYATNFRGNLSYL